MAARKLPPLPGGEAPVGRAAQAALLPGAPTGGNRPFARASQQLFFPCSGNGNGTSWNNRTSNGNFWSASFNSARNARNLNFNPTGVNPQNNNNRYNGFAVRAVQLSA